MVKEWDSERRKPLRLLGTRHRARGRVVIRPMPMQCKARLPKEKSKWETSMLEWCQCKISKNFSASVVPWSTLVLILMSSAPTLAPPPWFTSVPPLPIVPLKTTTWRKSIIGLWRSSSPWGNSKLVECRTTKARQISRSLVVLDEDQLAVALESQASDVHSTSAGAGAGTELPVIVFVLSNSNKR